MRLFSATFSVLLVYLKNLCASVKKKVLFYEVPKWDCIELALRLKYLSVRCKMRFYLSVGKCASF